MIKKARVIIAGAGIGGLAAAACLFKRGFNVRICEKVPELKEVGAGIRLSPNAIKILYDLGLQNELEQRGVKLGDGEKRNYTGEVFHKILAKEIQQNEREYGVPTYNLHRADLQKMLLDKVLSWDPDCVKLNANVLEFREKPDKVTVTLENGVQEEGDIFIGADGIKSTVRNQLVGATPVTYTGWVAWRFLIPLERIPPDIMNLTSISWRGPKKFAIAFRISAGKLLNFVSIHELDTWEEESWTQRRPWQELKDMYKGWDPILQAIIDAANRNECYRSALNIHMPLKEWSTGRVTLLGDAAHPVLPFTAQGACMAIEDGAVIARALEQASSVAEGLQLYQRARVTRTTRISVEEGTKESNVLRDYSSDNLQHFLTVYATIEDRKWLFGYDALKVPLK